MDNASFVGVDKPLCRLQDRIDRIDRNRNRHLSVTLDGTVQVKTIDVFHNDRKGAAEIRRIDRANDVGVI
jgi:hypothetical protein